MAFDRDKLYQQAQTAITENNLFFIEDVVAFIPCSKPTFYEHFPIDSNELNNLKDLLEKKRFAPKPQYGPSCTNHRRHPSFWHFTGLFAHPKSGRS